MITIRICGFRYDQKGKPLGYGMITEYPWYAGKPGPFPGDILPPLPTHPHHIPVVRQRRWIDPDTLIIDTDLTEL